MHKTLDFQLRPLQHKSDNLMLLKVQSTMDLVFLITHMGLAQQVGLSNIPEIKGVDYILGADTHERVRKPIEGKYAKVTEPGAFGSFISKFDIVVENDLALNDIAEIRLHVGDYHNLMCQPLAERSAPATLADAKFSLPFLVSIAIVRRGMNISDFTEAGLRDEEVLGTARKISLVSDASLDWKLDLPPGRVEIHARDGRSWTKEGHNVPGNADNPMTWSDVCEKFRECASVAANPVSDKVMSRVIELAEKLESMPDATELLRDLS